MSPLLASLSPVAVFVTQAQRAQSQEPPALSRLAAEWRVADSVTRAQRVLPVSEQVSSQELPGEFPLMQAQSLWRECWIQLWLLAAQLALRAQRLARTLLVQPPVGLRLALPSRAYFPLVAEWRLRVSGQLHLIQERQEQRRARAWLPWPPGLVPVRGRHWLWAGSVAPLQRWKARRQLAAPGFVACPTRPFFGPRPRAGRLPSE